MIMQLVGGTPATVSVIYARKYHLTYAALGRGELSNEEERCRSCRAAAAVRRRHAGRAGAVKQTEKVESWEERNRKLWN